MTRYGGWAANFKFYRDIATHRPARLPSLNRCNLKKDHFANKLKAEGITDGQKRYYENMVKYYERLASYPRNKRGRPRKVTTGPKGFKPSLPKNDEGPAGPMEDGLPVPYAPPTAVKHGLDVKSAIKQGIPVDAAKRALKEGKEFGPRAAVKQGNYAHHHKSAFTVVHGRPGSLISAPEKVAPKTAPIKVLQTAAKTAPIKVLQTAPKTAPVKVLDVGAKSATIEVPLAPAKHPKRIATMMVEKPVEGNMTDAYLNKKIEEEKQKNLQEALAEEAKEREKKKRKRLKSLKPRKRRKKEEDEMDDFIVPPGDPEYIDEGDILNNPEVKAAVAHVQRNWANVLNEHQHFNKKLRNDIKHAEKLQRREEKAKLRRLLESQGIQLHPVGQLGRRPTKRYVPPKSSLRFFHPRTGPPHLKRRK